MEFINCVTDTRAELRLAPCTCMQTVSYSIYIHAYTRFKLKVVYFEHLGRILHQLYVDHAQRSFAFGFE